MCFPTDFLEVTLIGHQPVTIITSDHHKQVNGILNSCFITGMSDRKRNYEYSIEGRYLKQTETPDTTKEMDKDMVIIYVVPCIDI